MAAETSGWFTEGADLLQTSYCYKLHLPVFLRVSNEENSISNNISSLDWHYRMKAIPNIIVFHCFLCNCRSVGLLSFEFAVGRWQFWLENVDLEPGYLYFISQVRCWDELMIIWRRFLLSWWHYLMWVIKEGQLLYSSMLH